MVAAKVFWSVSRQADYRQATLPAGTSGCFQLTGPGPAGGTYTARLVAGEQGLPWSLGSENPCASADRGCCPWHEAETESDAFYPDHSLLIEDPAARKLMAVYRLWCERRVASVRRREQTFDLAARCQTAPGQIIRFEMSFVATDFEWSWGAQLAWRGMALYGRAMRARYLVMRSAEALNAFVAHAITLGARVCSSGSLNRQTGTGDSFIVFDLSTHL